MKKLIALLVLYVVLLQVLVSAVAVESDVDHLYISEQKRTVGDIESLFRDARHVIFVTPDVVDEQVESALEVLRLQIVETFDYDAGKISRISSGDIGCNSYGDLDDGLLIIVGDRGNNNAVKCVPWFDVGSKPTDTFKASIEVERNVWATDDYAVVVSGPNVSSGLLNLVGIVEFPALYRESQLGGKSTVYIHELSNPPEGMMDDSEATDHLIGFVLGTCEEGDLLGEKGGCIASDMVLSLTPPTDIITDARDVAMYCAGGIVKGAFGKATKWDALMCGGSLLGGAASVGKYVTAPTVVGAIAGTGADYLTTSFKSVLKVVKASFKEAEFLRFMRFADSLKIFDHNNFLRFVKVEKRLVDIDGSDLRVIEEGTKKFTTVNAQYKLGIKAFMGQFDDETLNIVIRNVDDYEGLAKGSDAVLRKYKTLEDLESAVKVCTSPCRAPTKVEFAEITKNIGKIFGKSASTIEDSFSGKFKSVDELSSSVKAGEHGDDVKKVFEGTLKSSSAEQARVTTAFANLQNNAGAKILKSEKEIESVVGKGNKLGADFVSEIAGKKVGVSVRTIEKGVKDLESISRPLIKGAEELTEVRKASGLWDEDIVYVLVKNSEYDKAVKYADETFRNTKKLDEMAVKGIDLNKVRVVITKAKDYIVNG